MSRRLWISLAVAEVLVIGGIGAIGYQVGWFDERIRYTSVPTCQQLFTAPDLQDAAKTAFATVWNGHEEHYSEILGGAWCEISAGSLDGNRAPRFRALVVSVDIFLKKRTDTRRGDGVRGAQWSYELDRNNRCNTTGNAGLTDEHDLGDEAISCWTTDRYGDPFRHIVFRASNLVFSVELAGSDAGTDPHGLQVRSDLEDNTRCVAEALALQFDIHPRERHSCGPANQAL